MFKRLFWLAIGLGLGFGMSFWLMRFIRETVDRYRPERVSQDLAGAISKLGDDLRSAVREGRMAMAEREEELRTEVDAARSARKHGGPGL
ncbi:MAG: hypothetical protein QOI47_1201 [Actinomycetota bacterium]|nr:hypothetical protein [Actinomycetota bacterium]